MFLIWFGCSTFFCYFDIFTILAWSKFLFDGFFHVNGCLDCCIIIKMATMLELMLC